ncbi:MAG: xylose isomerase [Verrucomicrobiota bacterium]
MTAFYDVDGVAFEGRDSANALAFKHYNPEEKIEGKSMREHLRFGAAYWHTMRNPLADPFGVGTAEMPWDDGSNSVANAQNRARVFFEFMEKMQIDYYCFHDRDVAPEGETLAESNRHLDAVAKVLKQEQERTGKKLLWGTACLFINRRYAHGAATSPQAEVFAYAAAQTKKAMEVTHELGGEAYLFWGGREGYSTLLNTDMQREREHLARFFHMAVDYKKEIGFKGPFYIEPKPKEPTTHQYDSDAAACLNFLREFDLLEHFKLNIETNHAWLAGQTMRHELATAAAAGALGSVDANCGTNNVGWDTDQFPWDLYTCLDTMLVVLGMGGFTTGGLNFDAKRRRESFQPIDLFYGHILGMDAYARALKAAAAIRADGRMDSFIRQRYATWDDGLGEEIEAGKVGFKELEKYTLKHGEPVLPSGRQEQLEALYNEFL